MIAIVGKNDFPMYKLNIGSHSDSKSTYLDEFIIHSSLDFVETKMIKTASMFLKEVDNHQTDYVYCFLTASNVKFLALIDTKNEDGAKSFFIDMYDLYVKTIMNPFYEPNTRINFPEFDSKVKDLVKKYFSNMY